MKSILNFVMWFLLFVLAVFLIGMFLNDDKEEKEKPKTYPAVASKYLTQYDGKYTVEVDGYTREDIEMYILNENGRAAWAQVFSGSTPTITKQGTWIASEDEITITIQGNTGEIKETFTKQSGKWRNGNRELKAMNWSIFDNFKEELEKPLVMYDLSNDQINEYINEHLPHRHSILVAYKDLRKNNANCSEGFYHVAYNASLISLRIHLNILGLKLNKSHEIVRFNGQSDDITIADLGGKLLNTNLKEVGLNEKEEKLLKDVYFMSNKGFAHFTQPIGFKQEELLPATDITIKLFEDCFYKPLNMEMKFKFRLTD